MFFIKSDNKWYIYGITIFLILVLFNLMNIFFVTSLIIVQVGNDRFKFFDFV